jgi:hypothetical protein
MEGISSSSEYGNSSSTMEGISSSSEYGNSSSTMEGISSGSEYGNSSSTVEGNNSSSDAGNSSSLSGNSSSSSVAESSSGNSSSSSIPTAGGNSSESQGTGQFATDVFIDPRDSKEYRYEVLSTNNAVWMRDNLNYSRNNTTGYCYGVDVFGTNPNRDSTSCGSGYGRAYTWSVAMDGTSGSNAQGLCPKGWHIPAHTEWSSNVSRSIFAGNYNLNEAHPPLGWKSRGTQGLYWTSTSNSYFAFTQTTGTAYQMNTSGGASDYFSVRCVANASWDCGSATYNPSSSFCYDNIVYPRCNRNMYNPATTGCCGSSTYTLAERFCVGTTLYSKCSGADYDPSTQGCQDGVIVPKCGNLGYNPETQFCSGTTVYDKCGGLDYTPSTQGCQGTTILPKCGSYLYNPDNQFCSGTTVYDKCGGLDYIPSTQGCQGTTILPKCGSYLYNPNNQFCSGTTIYDKCGGKTYNPDIEKCQDNEVVSAVIFFEDFETGASSRWEVMSGADAVNKWVIGGTNTYYEGSRSAYISSNGSTYGYNQEAPSMSILYRIIVFPSQTTTFSISFRYKGIGETSYDYMDVYLLPADEGFSTPFPTSYRIGSTRYSGTNYTNWTLVNITSLSATTYSGKTYRLVFKWENDNLESNGPPAAIDDVIVK